MKDILKHVGYAVTKGGRVWSKKTKKYLSQHLTHNGYLIVSLYDKRQYCYRIHRLVLEAFVGLCPAGMECRHLDGSRANNNLDNICWGTKQENFADMKRHGKTTGAIGEKQGCAKLTEQDVLLIRSVYNKELNGYIRWNQRQLAKIFGVSQMAIWCIIKRKTWKHI